MDRKRKCGIYKLWGVIYLYGIWNIVIYIIYIELVIVMVVGRLN